MAKKSGLSERWLLRHKHLKTGVDCFFLRIDPDCGVVFETSEENCYLFARLGITPLDNESCLSLGLKKKAGTARFIGRSNEFLAYPLEELVSKYEQEKRRTKKED